MRENMGKENQEIKGEPKKITRFKGETKLSKMTKEALVRIRAFKGIFG
jgi:hypothetical protein